MYNPTRYIRRAPAFSHRDQIFFIKRLSFLVGAQVPLVESLSMLAGQMRGSRSSRAIRVIESDLSNGQTLARSLAKFPRMFSEFSVRVIAVGESTGTLSQNLQYVAEELQKRHALRTKVVSALIYPALVASAMTGVALFLVAYLFPKIMPVFYSFHTPLPVTTRSMIALSNFVTQYGVAVLCVLALVGVTGVVVYKKSRRVRRWGDRIILRVPIFGAMLRLYIVATLCRTLGLLLSSGVQLGEALALMADTKNLVYQDAYKDAAQAVARGEKVSTRFLSYPELFPDTVGYMVAVGERSGTLPETLVYLSQMYDTEVDDFSKNLTSLVEPVLMVVMGVVVGYIAVSIITPLYSITQNIHA